MKETLQRITDNFTLEKKYRIPTLVLFLCFLAQMGFLLYMNLFAGDKILNFDGANAMLHGIEIFKSGSVRVPGWHDTTQLEYDMAAFLAGPLYGLTGNIFLSYGIANILFAALYVLVIRDIFRSLEKSDFHLLIALNLVFTPYCIGMIDYYSMLFYQAAFYTMRVLIPLLMFALLLKKRERRKTPGTVFFFLLLILFSFLSGLSCGIYVLISGVAPIAAVFVLELLLDGGFCRFGPADDHGGREACRTNAFSGIRGLFAHAGADGEGPAAPAQEAPLPEITLWPERKYERYHLAVIGAAALFSLAGIFAVHLLGFGGLGDKMLLTNYQNMSSNLDAVFLSFFMVLDAIPGANTPVLSTAGIVYLAKAALACLLLIVFIRYIRRLFWKEGAVSFGKFTAFLLAWNVLEFIFCETRYGLSNPIIENRYYLIPLIPLLLLFAMDLEEWSRVRTRALEIFVNFAAMCMTILLAVGCDYYVVQKFDADAFHIKDIVAYVKENAPDIDSVILLHEPDTQGIYRLLDPEHKYAGFDQEKGHLVVYDYYDDYIRDLGDSNLILLYQWETPEELLGPELAAGYEKLGEVDWFGVYFSAENHFPAE